MSPVRHRGYSLLLEEGIHGLFNHHPGFRQVSKINGWGEQTTVSSGHPYRQLGGAGGDIGGGFSSVRHLYSDSSKELHATGGFGSSYDGRIFAHRHSFTPIHFPTLVPSSQAALAAYGTTAIARCVPTNPISGISNFVGELRRDGIPAIVGAGLLRSRLKDYRSYGSEYLNVEFGWKPFLSDLQKFATVAQDSEMILKRYESDSGRNIRRRFSFDSITETTSTTAEGQATPPLNGWLYDDFVGEKTTIDTTTRKKWFSGCFTYYLALGNTAYDKLARCAQEAEKLLGVEPTPEVLWNLAPWTWAADWVTNIGDIATNVSAFSSDGLVMRYGYIMEHSIRSVDHTLTGIKLSSEGSPLTLKQTFATEAKVRYGATPYGFGLDIAGFTPRQMAITAALGISGAGSRAF